MKVKMNGIIGVVNTPFTDSGEIDVDSEVGRGSVFTVKLPVDIDPDERMEG